MRPIIMAGLPASPPLSFAPAPGAYTVSSDGVAEFTISASAPVMWNWSSTGSLPVSTVPKGGVSDSITFDLGATSTTDKSCTVTVTVGANAWTIDMTAIHHAGPTP